MREKWRFVLAILLAAASAVKSGRIYHSPQQIDDFLVSRDNATIYVASVNHLTTVSVESLLPIVNRSIGPINDSPWCSADGKSCLRDNKPSPTNVHTKILHHLNNGHILHCGSVRLGVCSTYSTPHLSLLTDSMIPVAANSPNHSTVSLIVDNRLIVAASPTPTESPYRDPFPVVAIRTLPSFNIENAGDLEGEAAVFLRASLKNSIRYLYSFTYEHFVFIVSVMSSKENRQTTTTRLIRFCKNDTKFVSYSEIELQCRAEDNAIYSHLNSMILSGDKLIGAYSSNSNDTKTAFCIFSMQRIKLTYWYNIDRCRSGTDSIKLAHIGRDSKCVNKAHIPLDEDSCELGVGGSIELVELSNRVVIGSISSLIDVDGKAIFAGTKDAQVIMLKWGIDGVLEEYGRKDVGDRSSGTIVQKMIRYGDFLFAQLPYAIAKVQLSTCHHHSSCNECLVSPDPLCQWCHPTQTCVSSGCFSDKMEQCPISDGEIQPSAVAVNRSTPVLIRMRNLPAPKGFNYQCQFGKYRTPAIWESSSIKCSSAQLDKPGTLQLSLITSLSSKPIISHNFTVFDCSQHQTCSKCVEIGSSWGCEWCAISNKCETHNTCRGKTSSKCVRLHPIHTPIAIGSNTDIIMKANNLDVIEKSIDHYCALNISGRMTMERAEIDSSTVKCKRMMFDGDMNAKSVQIELRTNDHVVDSTNVTLYSCQSLASDCSSCISLSPSLSCGWCEGKCSHECRSNKKVICDPPEILRFEPSSGPIEGGTIIKIIGKDLGVSEEDVRGKIFVAKSRCDLVSYRISTEIRCRVAQGTSSGPIKISVGRTSMTTVESKDYYSFVQVTVFSIYPLFGPLSGGTRVTVYGQNLNVGTGSNLTIGGKNCPIVEKNSSISLTCITPKGISIGKTAKVQLRVDSSLNDIEQPFEYRPDPIIHSISPLSSFKSGGRTITVRGESFDAILDARMYLLSSARFPIDIVSDLAPCRIHNSTMMTCNTPRVIETVTRRFEYTRLPIGFGMDNVSSVANMGRRLMMNIYPDPELNVFKGIRHHQGEQPLILEGRHLNLAAEPNDFKIFIGSERCYVTLVDIKQLVCSGPVNQPAATDERGNEISGSLPQVTVIVGGVRQELGLIEYASDHLSIQLLVLMIILFVIACIFLMVITGFWKKKRKQREKDYRKIQLQMESLENNVRKECKQAFAELQTNLILSPKAKKICTPEFVSFSKFVENLLWSDSALSVAPTLTRTLPVTLAQFHAMLSFKHFIFTIVEAAETDTAISASEKSMLASLLISVLLRNFGYCTEIVTDLLRMHIAKSVQAKRGELLFRNSDSVVEKMVAKWMSICLYSHVTNQMNSFFYLYKALQFQNDKGPVDAVTGDARYTINESRLLRESIETTTLTIRVLPLDNSIQTVNVDVHECDAICQVKEKILSTVYLDTPYSQRPRLCHFDLVFKCPKQGDVKLVVVQDESAKPPIRLLTVADYNITDGSEIQMVHAIYQSNNYRDSFIDSGQSSWSSLERCVPSYSSSKYYHLTNPLSGTLSFKKHSNSIPKSIPEVYLTRLLTSKGTVQSYVEDFLESVLYMNECSFPPPLKQFFDFLDREAAFNGVSENICQQWKANSYVLRVWANFVRNPHLIIDEPHSIAMDGNLSTIAQTLMDCFSFSEPVLGAHSPSSRLLFAKDVARLRPLSVDLFKRVKNSPVVSNEQWTAELVDLSNDLSTCKGSSMALSELLSWVRGNGIKITQLLSAKEHDTDHRLSLKLSQVINVCLDTDNHIYSTISDYE